jgi:hypothetical protein
MSDIAALDKSFSPLTFTVFIFYTPYPIPAEVKKAPKSNELRLGTTSEEKQSTVIEEPFK